MVAVVNYNGLLPSPFVVISPTPSVFSFTVQHTSLHLSLLFSSLQKRRSREESVYLLVVVE